MRGKVILILLAVAALAGGGLYYVFGVHLPGQTRAKARDEIERWETRLGKVQTCLLGDEAQSPDFAEALAIRELANEVDRKVCTSAVSALSRGEAEDTGIAAVEHAWHDVDVAVSAVARGFADSLDRSRSSFDALAKALAKIDDADRALREAAGMSALPARPGGKLATAQLIPLALGDYKIKGLDAWLRPSAGGMVALVERDSSAKIGDAHVQIVLVPGQPPVLMPFQSDVRPSITTGSWGAGPVKGGSIRVGAIDDQGRLSDDAKLDGTKDARPFVIFSLGTAQAGSFAYVQDQIHVPQQLAIARVTAGKPTAEPAHEAEEYAFALDPPSRGLLAWSTSKGAQAIVVEPAGNKLVDLGAGAVGQACLTNTRGWVTIERDQFVSFPVDDSPGTPVPHVLPQHDLVGCDATSVLLSRAGHRYSICTDTCRIAELPAKPLALPALAGGKVIAVATRGQVLAIWRENGPPLYFTVPRAIRPKLVHASDKVVDVIANTDDGMVIARAQL